MNTEKIKNDLINVCEVISTNNLFKRYSFVERDHYECLISQGDIEKIKNKLFCGIKSSHVEVVISLADKCEIDEHPNCYNFYVYENGQVTIGETMRQIKENLEEIKQAYEDFKNREFYNIIKFEL